MTRIDAADLVRIEALAVEDLFAAATTAERDALGLYCEWHGNTLVTACSAEPDILMNRTIGFTPRDAAELPRILDVYRRHDVTRAFVSVEEEQLEFCEETLAQHPLKSARPWVKFTRGNAAAPAVNTSLQVREVDAREGEAFGRVVCNAFDLPQGWAPILGRLGGREHWHVFGTFAGDQLAGGGAMYLRDNNAWLGFGATAPEFRQRGSQSAVMSARIARARELGATVMQTETGEAVPGDPQHSYKNIERGGFRPHHRIINFALARH